MKRKIAALAATTAVLAGGAIAATAAPSNAAGSPGCATRAEFAQIKHGMSPQRVAQIFGTPGKVSFTYQGTYVFDLDREYKPCQPYTQWSNVEVSFSKPNRFAAWHVDGKNAYWIS